MSGVECSSGSTVIVNGSIERVSAILSLTHWNRGTFCLRLYMQLRASGAESPPVKPDGFRAVEKRDYGMDLSVHVSLLTIGFKALVSSNNVARHTISMHSSHSPIEGTNEGEIYVCLISEFFRAKATLGRSLNALSR